MQKSQMKIVVLSSKAYSPKGNNFGDCILIDTGSRLIVFDCGSKEHALRVEQYLRKAGYSKAIVVLSHNDTDHFDGIPYLVERGLVSRLYCHLFLKHKQEVLALLDDRRVTDHSVGERIKGVCKNIETLSKKVDLRDAITAGVIAPGVKIVGPSEDYALETITRALKSSKDSKIDAETVINASSIQVLVEFPQARCLLCGDASFEAISGILDDCSVIQLPHHGKAETANKIFRAKCRHWNTVYLVSDNTGSSNGGSGDLDTSGKHVLSTLKKDICYPPDVLPRDRSEVRGTLGLF